MSTGYPQLFHEVSTWLILLGGIAALAGATYVAVIFAKLATFRSEFSRLRLDFAELSERFMALEERFTRFQKREGMRQARAEKTSAADLKDEAQRILAEAGVAPGASGQPRSAGLVSKQDLYRRRH